MNKKDFKTVLTYLKNTLIETIDIDNIDIADIMSECIYDMINDNYGKNNYYDDVDKKFSDSQYKTINVVIEKIIDLFSIQLKKRLINDVKMYKF